MVALNFDPDLIDRMQRELNPQSPCFRALPMEEQLRQLRPFIEAQRLRDRKRLSKWLAPTSA